MMYADFFLAWKYFKPKRSAVSVITLISVIGVGLGVGVLIVVLAVMTGFTDKMKEKLLETSAHAQVYSKDRSMILNVSPVVKEIQAKGGSALPVMLAPVLMQVDERFVPKQMIAFEGDPGEGKNGLNLKNAILPPAKFSLEPGEIIISYLTAREIRAEVGDKVLLHAPSRLAKLVKKDSDGKIRLNTDTYYPPGEYRISGIFSFGKYDFDRDIIFLNLEDANTLFGQPLGSASSIYLWTKDPFQIEAFLADLPESSKNFDFYSWKEINARLLGVLAVEKNMQFFLLAFIVLVAAFSITNTLITTVIQKTREIGALKSMGASSGTIMRIFILQGFFVGAIGTGFGICFGMLVVRYRMGILHAMRFLTGQEIFPKEFYVFSELPAHIVFSDVVWISLISIVLCTFGGVVPAFRAAKLDPAGALRYE